MAYRIRKRVDEVEMWLRTDFPAVTWGPLEQAKSYATIGSARRALASLPRSQQIGVQILAAGAQP